MREPDPSFTFFLHAPTTIVTWMKHNIRNVGHSGYDFRIECYRRIILYENRFGNWPTITICELIVDNVKKSGYDPTSG